MTEKSIRHAVGTTNYEKFQKAWHSLDPKDRGFIPRAYFPDLLRTLRDTWFDTSIYPPQFRVPAIMISNNFKNRMRLRADYGASYLNRTLRSLPVKTIRTRRKALQSLYEEVMVSAVDGQMNKDMVLIIFAHYKMGELGKRYVCHPSQNGFQNCSKLHANCSSLEKDEDRISRLKIVSANLELQRTKDLFAML
jgi:hypothetical protein